MHLLASVLKKQGKYAESEALNLEVLERRRKVLGGEHKDTLLSLNNLANVLGRQGKLTEAVTILREAFETQKRVLGETPSPMIPV